MTFLQKDTMSPLILIAALAAGTVHACVASAQVLDDTCTASVNGQHVQIDADGTFFISNVAAPDVFGPEGPGSPPDFFSDEPVRIVGVCTGGAQPLYFTSECFRFSAGETYVIGNLMFSNEPPLSIQSLSAAPAIPALTTVGQTTTINVTGTLADGSTAPVLPQDNCMTFRTSNPAIATVNAMGVVSAVDRGTALISVSVEGVTAVTTVIVSLGDPLTTVVGVAQSVTGSPFVGADVEIVGLSGFGLSDNLGCFSIPGVATQRGAVSARLKLPGGVCVESQPYPPQPGAFTDVGIITERGCRIAQGHWFRSLVSAGDCDELAMWFEAVQDDTGTIVFNADAELNLQVVAPDGTDLLNQSGNGLQWHDVVFPQNGVYRVIVSSVNDSSGPFGLIISDPPIAVEWFVDADGLWNDEINWSGVFVPTSAFDVRIDRPWEEVTVSINNPAEAANLYATDAIVVSNVLDVPGTIHVTGPFTISQGRIENATILPGSTVQISYATLDNVTLEANAFCPGSRYEDIAVYNGLTLNGRMTFSQTTIPHGTFGTEMTFYGSQALDGTGEIVFTSAVAGRVEQSGAGQTLTIDSGVTLRGRNAMIGRSDAVLVNRGTISANNVGYFEVNGTAWRNEGTLEVDHPDSGLGLNGTWTNDGVIRVSDGELRFLVDGPFSPGTIGTLQRTGGTVVLSGTWDNAGQTSTLNATTGSWYVTGAVQGGVLDTLDGTSWKWYTGTMDGVTVNGSVFFPGVRHEDLYIENGLTLNGRFTLSQSPNVYGTQGADIYFNGSQAVTGSGEIVFTADVGGSFQSIRAGETLTIEPGITLRGKRARIGRSDSALINRGTISANNGGVFEVYGTAWRNEGTVEVSHPDSTLTLNGTWTNTGVIRISDGELGMYVDGPFSMPSLGTFQRTGGTVLLSGTWDNAGQISTLNAATGSWYITGTVHGGVLDTLDGTSWKWYTGTMDGVTVNGNVFFPGVRHEDLYIENGLTLNGRFTLSQSPNAHGTQGADIYFNGSQAVTGSGEIVFTADVGGSFQSIRAGETLTIEPGITLRGKRARIGRSDSALINRGSIRSNNNNYFGVSGNNWVNEGLLHASNRGGIGTNGSWTNEGTVEVLWDGQFGTNDNGFDQADTGTLRIELGGNAVGQYGRLTVQSPHSATLGGTLEVILASGFDPAVGDFFDVLVADNIVGQFANESLPDLGPSAQFEVQYLGTSVRVRVAAIP